MTYYAPTVPRMVRRSLLHWWLPARKGDAWAAINSAWREIAQAFDTYLYLSGAVHGPDSHTP